MAVMALIYIIMFKCFNFFVENMLFSHYFESGIVFNLYYLFTDSNAYLLIVIIVSVYQPQL